MVHEGEDGGRRDISREKGNVDVYVITVESHIEGAHEKECGVGKAQKEQGRCEGAS